MSVLYSIGLYFYTICALVASLFNKKIRTLIKGQMRTFGVLRKNIGKDDRVVWFHAASLGEFEQGRPLMERLRKTHPEYKILLTFFSPSGYEVRKDYDGADVICYMPFDTPGNVMSFLRLSHPEIAVFIKYEFWHNYLYTMRRRGVKVYSVSSVFRPGQHFFKWWGGGTGVLRCFDRLFVQNEESKDLLVRHGVDRVTVVGDTRFDRVADIRRQAVPLPVVETFKDGKPTFIAGSSWQPDEHIYIPYFNEHKDWKLIIAPHVISESHLDEICAMLQGRKVVLYTEAEGCGDLKDADVLIVNCFGKLSSIYRYADVALVGGGFGVGIHNVPEAAIYAVPVLFGPNNKKFREAQHLLKCGGSFEFTDSDTFRSLMDHFISDPDFLQESGDKAGEYIMSNVGASDKCFDAIFGK